jgi:hypothetical protein
MFPPMTPAGERKIYETELEVLEREAMWHAELEREANHISLFARVANLWARLTRQPQPTAVPCLETQELPATSGC